MTAAFIIAEYNPVHLGHRYHICQTKIDTKADIVAVIMSGSMTQRCESAALSKWERAEMAVRGGADLVFELPFPFSSMSANGFAAAGVFLASATGANGYLSFGSESGELTELSKLTELLEEEDVDRLILKKVKSSGSAYAKARSDAVEELYGGHLSELLKNPNNILAVEYLKELKQQKSRLTPFTVKREKAGYHEREINDGFSGATFIRELMKEGDERYLTAVPVFVAERLKLLLEKGFAPCDMEHMARAMIFELRNKPPEELEFVLEVSEGLENRLLLAAKTADSYQKLCDTAKTKRYTMSRIRRAVLFSYFSVTKDFLNKTPDYLKVLAFNKNGRAFLKEIKETATLPVITKPADGRALLENTQIFDLEAKATGFQSLCSKKVNMELSDFLCGPVYIKE